MLECLGLGGFCFWVVLTWFPLAPFEGVVDVDEGEVVSLGVMEPSVALMRLVDHASRGRQETARRCHFFK